MNGSLLRGRLQVRILPGSPKLSIMKWLVILIWLPFWALPMYDDGGWIKW